MYILLPAVNYLIKKQNKNIIFKTVKHFFVLNVYSQAIIIVNLSQYENKYMLQSKRKTYLYV